MLAKGQWEDWEVCSLLRVFVFFLGLCSAVPGWAFTRYALVIGNDDYEEVVDLQKARNDATAVSEALDAEGYEVTTLLDAKRRQMNQAISTFTGKLEPGDVAMVFFAGHGVEIDGENYLLPTDVLAPNSGDEDLVKTESIALSRLLDQIRQTGARTTLAIIDACRENPFAAATGRSIGGTRGLGRISAPEGTFVIFSAGAGQLALDRLSDDDPAQNSVFTRALLPRLGESGLELRDMVASVRRDVRDLAASVGHRQFPAYYDELLGDFYMASDGDVQVATAPPTEQDRIRSDFELARGLGTREALESFLDAYEDSEDKFVLGLAQQMLAALEAQDVTPPMTTEARSEPVRTPAPIAPIDPRAVMRATQAELNRLGCDAGAPDGVAGPRTRAAFARFLAEAPGTALAAIDLGSETALASLRAQSSRICTTAVAAAPASGASQAPVTAPTPQAAVSTLSGTWAYFAKCPLFIRVTGSIRFSGSGQSFSGPIADSLGNSGTASATLVGRTIQGRNFWTNNPTETWTATLSADGRTYSGRSLTAPCTFTARRG